MTHTGPDAAIRAWAANRRLPEAHLERWLKMSETDRAAVLSVAQTLRLTTGAIATALATLEEISLRDNCSVESVLMRDEVARIIKSHNSAPARAKAFLEALRVIRFPRLAETVSRLKAEIAALNLPRGIAVLLPRDLASDELRIELRARDAAQLKRLIDELCSRAPKIAELIEILGGHREL